MMRRSTSFAPLHLLKLVRSLPQFAKLFWRLFRDRRVPLRAKAIVVGAVCYLVLPIDLVPDILPFFGFGTRAGAVGECGSAQITARSVSILKGVTCDVSSDLDGHQRYDFY